MSDDTELNPPRAIRLTEKELQDIVEATVHETFKTLGVDASEPIEMQRDFQHLRDWRTTTDAVKRRGILTLAGLFVASMAALVLMALRGDSGL